VSYGVGVERTFPLHSPSIGKLEVVTRGKVRRAKLYYLRELRGKKARIRERRIDAEELAALNAVVAEEELTEAEEPQEPEALETETPSGAASEVGETGTGEVEAPAAEATEVPEVVAADEEAQG
jgi:hypothetical protein